MEGRNLGGAPKEGTPQRREECGGRNYSSGGSRSSFARVKEMHRKERNIIWGGGGWGDIEKIFLK
jgi:hypothetical protein